MSTNHGTFFCLCITVFVLLCLMHAWECHVNNSQNEHFGDDGMVDVLVVNTPVFTQGIPLAMDQSNSVLADKIPQLPQNVFLEIHDAAAATRVDGRAMLKLDDAYHMGRAVTGDINKHRLVSVLPNTRALCHLCFMVKATNREFMFIEELNDEKKHRTIGVLRMEDVPLVQDVLKACKISSKKFQLVNLPVTNMVLSDSETSCVAVFADLDGVKSSGIVGDDVRLNFLQYDKSMDKTYMMSKYPFSIHRNFDMRLFFPSANLTSNFPVVSCMCFEYLLFMMNVDRVAKDTGLPPEQVDQLVRIIARRIENYDTVNAYLLEFVAYPAILPLLNEFDQRWMMTDGKQDGTDLHQLL